MGEPIRVYLEEGERRVFACAVDWPGWCRRGRGAEEALDELAAYAPRYAPLVAVVDGGPRLEGPLELEVVDRVAGGAGTEFGVPDSVPPTDERPLDAEEAARILAILDAAWATFDRAVAAATGVALRTGPRGGGRTLEKIVAHAAQAEAAYIVKLGARHRLDPADDPARAWPALREAARQAFRAIVRGREPDVPSATRVRWPPRYWARRTAWHALDHAWEIEDRAFAE